MLIGVFAFGIMVGMLLAAFIFALFARSRSN